MIKYFLLIVFLPLSFELVAQPSFSSQNFTIQGKVNNPAFKSFDLAVTGFMGNEVINVPVDRHGKFSKTIPLTSIQDLYLYLNDDAITIFAVPGDTIDISWNEKKFAESFKISSPDHSRDQELNLMYDLYKNYRSLNSYLLSLMFKRTGVDSANAQEVRNSLSGMLNTISHYPVTPHTSKIIYDVCFDMINDLRMGNLYEKYLPVLLETIRSANISSIKFPDPKPGEYDESKFFESDIYRDFLFSEPRPYIYTSKPTTGSYSDFDICEASMKLFAKSEVIRDWFLSKYVIERFSSSFDEAEAAYLKFLSYIKTKQYADTLQKFYARVSKLRPGNVAPAFTLPDENGNNHSLSDFKGKLVYIDFWAPACAPCISDIKNQVPKLHEKYAGRDIVFVNICVDDKVATWKEYLQKLNLSGINLKIEGWGRNPVCKDYNIGPIPHYVLIDQQGNIVNPNAPRPQQLNHANENIIDRLLK